MGYDAKIKEQVNMEKAKRLCRGHVNLKNFIGLLNLDVDVIVEREVIKKINNEAESEERNIVVKIKKMEEDEGYKVVYVDDSMEAVVENCESEVESEESNEIFNFDREEVRNREYATSLCVSHSHKSGVMTGEKKKSHRSSRLRLFGGRVWQLTSS
jgi:hypothetical protein